MVIRAFLPLGALFATFALAAFLGRVARERGRSAPAWVALATVAAVAVAVLAFLSTGSSLFDGDGQMSLGRAIAGPLAVGIGPLFAVAAVLALVWMLPESVATIGGARWTVYRLSAPDEPDGECLLATDGGALHVGDWCIAAGALEELVADGECLRVVSGGKTRLLMPAGEDLSGKEKTKQSQALAKRLRALVG